MKAALLESRSRGLCAVRRSAPAATHFPLPSPNYRPALDTVRQMALELRFEAGRRTKFRKSGRSDGQGLTDGRS